MLRCILVRFLCDVRQVLLLGRLLSQGFSKFVYSQQVQWLRLVLYILKPCITGLSASPYWDRSICWPVYPRSSQSDELFVKVIVVPPHLCCRNHDLTRLDSLSDTSLSDMSASEVWFSRPCSES